MTSEGSRPSERRPPSQRVEFRNSRGLRLVGDLYLSDSNSIILMSHGLTADRHESGKFDKAAGALQEAGYNVLRYDFSGCGESDDDTLTEAKQIDDIKSALNYIDQKGFRHTSLLGLSFGGLISVRGYNESIEAMVLWAPVTNAAQNPEEYYGEEGLRELREKGAITRRRPGTIRPETVIDVQLFEDWRSINQEELLRKIRSPILIIHGDQDPRIPIEDSRNAIRLLPQGSELVGVPGADHRFENDVDLFIEKTVEWFTRHAEPKPRS